MRDRGCEAPLALQLVVVLLLSLCHCVVWPTCAVAFLLGCEAPLALQLVVVVLLSLCHCVVGPTCAVAFLGPSSRDARRGRHSPRLRAPTLSTTSLRTEAPVMTANN